MTRNLIVKVSRVSSRPFSLAFVARRSEKSLTREDPKSLEAQSPNRSSTWSKSQAPRHEQMVGPRFEQTDMEAQPFPPSAIELVREEPIIFSDKRVVSCDGGDGPLGHPKVFINLDKGNPMPCGYCGLRFQNKGHH